jgi:predicted double-glycine peptidase
VVPLHTFGKRRIFGAALALFLSVSVSQSIFAKGASVNDSEPKLPANLIKIPMTRQATDYTCGVAALQSVLMYFGDEFMESELAKALKSNTKIGTAYEEMVRFSESKGYNVQVFKNMKIEDLKTWIDAGKPVIVLLQAWAERKIDYATAWDDGHYAVAVGYDDNNIYFMDPSTLGNYTFVPTKEFLVRWHDTDSKVKLHHFGMVVQKKAKRSYYSEAIKKME